MDTTKKRPVPVTINDISSSFEEVQKELEWLSTVLSDSFAKEYVTKAKSQLQLANLEEANYHGV